MTAATVSPLETRREVLSPWLITAAIMALAFLLRVPFWGQPFEMDEGLHAYMGWGWLQGMIPFRDMYNSKPPLVYLLHSLLFLVVEPTALNVKIFASFYAMITTLAVFALGRRVGGTRTGWASALLFALFSCGPRIQGGGVNCEVFMLLPYTLAAYCLIRGLEQEGQHQAFFFGLATGVAASIKQVAGVNLIWFCLYLPVRRNYGVSWMARHLLAAAAGFALPWLAFALYFALTGTLGKFFFWMVPANLAYVGEGYSGLEVLRCFYYQSTSVLAENGLLWVLAVFAILRRARQAGEKAGAEIAGPRPRVVRLLAAWLGCSFVGVALGGRFFAHYYLQLVPPLAVLGAIGLMTLAQEISSLRLRLARRPLSLVLAAALAGTAFWGIKTDIPYYLHYTPEQVSLHQYHTPRFAVTRYLGRYLHRRTCPEDLVYVWAVDPEINFYALRRSPSPFLIQVDLDSWPWDARGEIIRALRQQPPRYIVVLEPLSGFVELRDHIVSDYEEEHNLELATLKQLVPFRLFRLRDGTKRVPESREG
ncbi:MAG: ArnT family glycosyltransferase [Syntrophobacteria bacterium]